MRELGAIGLAMALLGLGTGASAGVTGVFTNRSVGATVPGGTSYSGPVGNAATQLTNQFGGLTAPYVNYQLASSISSSSISYFDNVTSLGAGSIVTASATNQLKVTFTNSGPAAVVPILNSTITPGGFGFYTMTPTSNPTFSSGKVSMGDINQSPEYAAGANTFDGFKALSTIPGAPIAEATFSFDIASNGVTVASYGGTVTLNSNPANPTAPIIAYHLTGLASTLNNFRLTTPQNSEDAVTYEWDATNIAIALGGPLAPGASQTLTYTTTVTAMSDATFNSSPPLSVCQATAGSCDLLAFAGFGDPIGKGNPSGARYGAGGSGGISGLTFNGYSLGLPSFDSATGQLSIPVATAPLASLPLSTTVAPAPEPATWALLLTGFGLVGYARRRRPDRAAA